MVDAVTEYVVRERGACGSAVPRARRGWKAPPRGDGTGAESCKKSSRRTP